MTYKLANTSRDADPYFGAVSLLLDGTDLQDKSLDTKTVTAVGDAQVSTAQSKWNGSSLYFDGNGDYLSTDISGNGLPGDFTIEGWMYVDDLSSNRAFICLGDDFFATGLLLYVNTNGRLAVFGSNLLILVGTTQTVSVQTWTHIACTRSSGVLRLFVNGVEDVSITNTTNYSNSALLVGAEYYNGSLGGAFQNGYLQDIRVTTGVARYTANFTPPTQPFTPAAVAPDYDPYFFPNVSLLLKGDGTNGSTNIVDSSYPAKTITVNGDAQISTAQSKFGGSSLYFDGTGDYLIADTDLTISNSNFTFEAWVNMDWTSQNCQIIGSSSNDFNLFIDSASGNLKFYNGGTVYTFSNSSIPADTWTHVAMVREGTGTNETKVYVNGVNTDTITLSKTWTTTIDIYVGRNGSAGTVYANGYIDDLRMTKGVARYTSNFTPPTKALPNY